MARIRSRFARLGMAMVVAGFGVVAYDAVSQVASAAPPPVIDTDFATYPAADAVPATCVGGNGGPGALVGYRAFIERVGAPAADPFIDPGPGVAGTPAASMRRFQALILPSDRVVVRWTNWAAGCEALTISFPLKATNEAFFDLADDQALVREPNGPFVFPFCNAGTDPCPAAGGGFELSTVIPQLRIVCGYQLDVVIGGPLETVGPHGSYYQNFNRVDAQQAGLGTFNITGANMLIDAANGAMPCVIPQRILIDKQWVGTGNVPPVNVPPEFLLTVTSSVSDTDPTVISTATCNVAGGVFTCDYRDTSDPSVPQGGLLVNNNSLLNVMETGFDGNTVDVTFPVGMSSPFVNCPAAGGPCLFTLTNTPPPPPPDETTTTAAPETIPPTTEPVTSPATIPNTLPATGSSGPAPMTIIGLMMVPLGAALIWLTRRRADQI
jgi:LPXTG-motif cell wall-anchored protein